jgi:hypothetical protein
MNTNTVNNWLGITTNLGIVVGLVFVGYEIHQNSLSIDRQLRDSQIAVSDGVRGAWQNWGLTIISDESVADIWVRGNASDELTTVEAERYKMLAEEMYRLTEQNFNQYSRGYGEPADWAIDQLGREVEGKPGLRAQFRDYASSHDSDFLSRMKELGRNQWLWNDE